MKREFKPFTFDIFYIASKVFCNKSTISYFAIFKNHFVTDNNIRVGRSGFGVVFFDEVGFYPVVGVDEHYVWRAGGTYAGVSASALLDVHRTVDYNESLVTSSILAQDVNAGVCRRVVEAYYLYVLEGLSDKRVKAFAQIALHIVDGDDDGYFRLHGLIKCILRGRL